MTDSKITILPVLARGYGSYASSRPGICRAYHYNVISYSFFKKNNLIYVFLAVLGLCCCGGLSLVVVHGLLIAVASLAVEHGL